jgi:hypothetical protein
MVEVPNSGVAGVAGPEPNCVNLLEFPCQERHLRSNGEGDVAHAIKPKRRDVDGSVVAKLDRLSRSVVDFARVLELARSRKWALVRYRLRRGHIDADRGAGCQRDDVGRSMGEARHRRADLCRDASGEAPGRHMGRVSVLSPSTGDRLLALRATRTLVGTAAQLHTEGLATATPGDLDDQCRQQGVRRDSRPVESVS